MIVHLSTQISQLCQGHLKVSIKCFRLADQCSATIPSQLKDGVLNDNTTAPALAPPAPRETMLSDSFAATAAQTGLHMRLRALNFLRPDAYDLPRLGRRRSPIPITPRGAKQLRATAAMLTTSLEDLGGLGAGSENRKPDRKMSFFRWFLALSGSVSGTTSEPTYDEVCGTCDKTYGFCNEFAPADEWASAGAVRLRLLRTTTVIPSTTSPLWSRVPGRAARGTQ